MFGWRPKEGAIVVDGQHTGATLQCQHCGGHWQVRSGSGKQRGWCMNCGGPTCGCAACDLCVPFEIQLEFMEGKGEKYRTRYWDDYVKSLYLRGIKGIQVEQRGLRTTKSGIILPP